MQTISVRATTASDASAVDALLSASYPMLMRNAYEPFVLAAALPLITRAQPDLLASGTYFVAETNAGRVVGCGGWTRTEPGRGTAREGAAHIRHFATDPDLTRRGIGRAILSRCVSEARAAGIRQLDCFASLNAEAFYVAFGFAPVSAVEIPLPGNVLFPALLMRRVL